MLLGESPHQVGDVARPGEVDFRQHGVDQRSEAAGVQRRLGRHIAVPNGPVAAAGRRAWSLPVSREKEYCRRAAGIGGDRGQVSRLPPLAVGGHLPGLLHDLHQIAPPPEIDGLRMNRRLGR